MIDSHCHLDRVDDLTEALDNDLTAMVTVGTDVDRSRSAVRLAEDQARVYAVVGVHPNEASLADDPQVRSAIEALADHPQVVAIGETGFDDHWQDESLETQRRAFDWHARVARAAGKPLVLHVRDRQGSQAASQAAERALRETPDVRGVLHCFAGDAGLLATGLANGWMVSFAGNLTYKRSERLREVASEVPEERLMVETDAPFLTPVPHRGKRNRPGWVNHTAAVLAEVRAVPLERLEAVLDANTRRFYGLSSD